MTCPPGYRETTSNQNGRLIVSCVPEISSQPETCSDSLFYQLLTGLPPCRSTTAPSADPRTQAEQNAADSYQRMIEALRRYREAQAAGATTPGPGPGTPATSPGNAIPATSGKQSNPYAANPNVARVVALGVGAVLIILALVKLQG